MELGQAGAAVAGIVVHPPVDLFLLEHLVESLQQSELLRGPVADADMTVTSVGDVLAEAVGQEAGAVVGNQERRLGERPMHALRFCAGEIDAGGDIGSGVAGGEMAGQQVARVVVDDGDRVPPAVAGDVDVGDVHLPQVVGPLRQQLEQLGRLVQFWGARRRSMQQTALLHDPVDDLVGRADDGLPPADDGDALVAPPWAGDGNAGNGLSQDLVDRFGFRAGLALCLGWNANATPRRRWPTQRLQQLPSARERLHAEGGDDLGLQFDRQPGPTVFLRLCSVISG